MANDEVPRGSLVLLEASQAADPVMTARLSSLHRIKLITEPNDVPSFVLMER
jgi:hypothetical protein